MNDAWKTATPKAVVAELRLGGWVMGRSGLLKEHLRLHKTDLIADLRKLPDDHTITYRIVGDAAATGRHASQRRTIVIWLGK